jgi:hypothetical protein
MAESITCNLVQNALDYLLLAGEQAGQDTPRMLKHAVATLADGLELLLKSRLEIDDWKLLFADEGEASQEKYEQGSFKSVTVDEAVKRLKKRCSVNLPARHKKLLGRLRDMRNRIRHFTVTTTRAAALSLIVRSYSFAIDFVADQIEPHRHADVGRELDLLRTLLGKYDEFVKGRLEEIRPSLEEPTYCPLIECMACLQRTLVVDCGTAQCWFCSSRLPCRNRPTYHDTAAK